MTDQGNTSHGQLRTSTLGHLQHGRFVFRNLGPIDYAEIELGDLTVIAGHNNTGKTYLAYSLYGFLRSWNQSPHLYSDIAYREESSASQLQPNSRKDLLVIDRLIAIASEKGTAEEALCDEIWNHDRTIISRIFSSHFSNHILPEIFSSTPDVFSESSVTIDIVNHNVGRFTTINALRPGPQIFLDVDTDSITLGNNERNQSLQSTVNYQRILDLYIQHLFPEFHHQTSVLTSERLSISLFYRELDFTRNQLINLAHSIRNRRGPSRDSGGMLSELIHASTSQYTLPIRDNIDYTRRIPDILRQKSDLYDQKLFSEIERLVQGHYTCDEGVLRFKSSDECEQDFDLPLHMASSSARGMSDLYFFLRLVAKKNGLLIIDEPESHLDTANQVLFARLLVQFVKSGIRVLITTHSDYLLKELNNLIMLDSDFDEKDEVTRSLNYRGSDGISPSAVRGYIAQNRGLTKCDVDEFGVDWPVFDTTIDKINEASNELSYRVRKRHAD